MVAKPKRLAAQHLIERHDVSERRASKVLGLSLSTKGYKSHPRDEEAPVKRMKVLAGRHRRFGLPWLHYLLKREGLVRSKDRAERVCRKRGLQLSKRRCKKMISVTRVPFEKAQRLNEIWSFDFVFDRTESNRRLRFLTI